MAGIIVSYKNKISSTAKTEVTDKKQVYFQKDIARSIIIIIF